MTALAWNSKLDIAKSLKSAIIQVIQNSATENDLESEVNSILKVTKPKVTQSNVDISVC